MNLDFIEDIEVVVENFIDYEKTPITESTNYSIRKVSKQPSWITNDIIQKYSDKADNIVKDYNKKVYTPAPKRRWRAGFVKGDWTMSNILNRELTYKYNDITSYYAISKNSYALVFLMNKSKTIVIMTNDTGDYYENLGTFNNNIKTTEWLKSNM